MANRRMAKYLSEYGMVAVLLLLCVYYSFATLQRRPGVGAAAGEDCAAQVLSADGGVTRVAIVAGDTAEDVQFADAAAGAMAKKSSAKVTRISGEPRVARLAFEEMATKNEAPGAIIATAASAGWLPRVTERVPAVANVKVYTPRTGLWPTFLTAENLLNVANQIVVIAVVAVGMTMVIITGGIDLSVGSLVALSAVVTGLLIRKYAGGVAAGTMGLVLCSLAAILAAGAVGAFSGMMITFFQIPPFIATLAMMQVASGLAYRLAGGQSIYEFPDSFTWLGRGLGFFGIPNAVMLMVALFVAAEVLMSRTRLGRYIYAVGGNAEAARLCGVGVGGVLMKVYALSGLAAGLGGVIVASQLKSSSPTYGQSYELYVIAAVVVGGTSLAGGEGKIMGTLIGALIMAVIQNGMNLTSVGSYSQKIVQGFVILLAVLVDGLKRREWRWPD